MVAVTSIAKIDGNEDLALVSAGNPTIFTTMRRLFGSQPKVAATAPGERVYAIGDIHGRYDLLRELMSKIVTHWEASDKRAKRVRLLFLGDIIDRGPDSAQCLRLVTNLVKLPRVNCLRGNHEDLLLRSIAGDGKAQGIWLKNGGIAALASLAVAPPRQDEDTFDFGERVKAAIPEEHLAMLRQTPTHVRSGDYFFVHAGVRPGVALAKQDDSDLLLIRDEFTQSTDWHGAIVVHGHSIVDEVDMRDNRIAIDTGAYDSGKLSCLCLEGTEREVIAT